MKRAILFALLLLCGSRPAFGQTMLLDVGPVVVGGVGAGATTATYIASDGSSVPLFSIARSTGTAIGATGRLTINLSRRFGIEVSSRWVRQAFRTKLADDTDGADATTAAQSVDRFVLGGGATVRLKRFGRWQTFARGNVGWLRELSDDQSLYQDGWVAEAGGGVNFLLKERQGRFRPYGIRTDIWLDVRHGGLSFTDKPRLFSPAVAAAIIFKL